MKKRRIQNKTNIDKLNKHNLKIKKIFFVYDTDETDDLKKPF